MSELPPGNRYLVPYLRLFPIWRRGMVLTLLDGLVDCPDGWYPDRFEDREVSREEAERIHRDNSPVGPAA